MQLHTLRGTQGVLAGEREGKGKPKRTQLSSSMMSMSVARWQESDKRTHFPVNEGKFLRFKEEFIPSSSQNTNKEFKGTVLKLFIPKDKNNRENICKLSERKSIQPQMKKNQINIGFKTFTYISITCETGTTQRNKKSSAAVLVPLFLLLKPGNKQSKFLPLILMILP